MRPIRNCHFRLAGDLTFVFILVVVLVGVAPPAGAQVSRVGAFLQGTVTDTSGAAAPRATVMLRNISTGQTRTLTADDSGAFRSEELPVGTYEVLVQQAGFAPYRHTGVVLSLGETARLDIALAPASLSQQMTVSAQPSVLDPTQTSVVSSVDQERIEELPVRTRNYLDFVLLSPGVSSAPHGLAGSALLPGSGFTFGGLRPRSNNVSIDGLDNNDEFTGSSRIELSPEIVQEFQVVNNGLSAESGGASGGSINVISRSGTNVIHGDAFIFAQDSTLNGRDPFETEPDKPLFRHFREGLAFGGPLVKGQTFYYAAVEQEHNTGQIGSDIDPSVASMINSVLASGIFPSLATRQVTTGFAPIARDETEAAGRLDHEFTKNTALMLRYAFTNNRESGDAFNTDGLMDASARGTTFTSDHGISASITTLIGTDAVSDIRLQLATREVRLGTNQSAGPEIEIAGLATFGRPYAGNSERRENHYQAEYAYTRTRGKNVWKAGGTVNRVRLRANLPDGFGGVYLFGSLADFLAASPDEFRQAFGNPSVNYPVTSFGAFAEDHWSLTRRFTVDLGIRYDFERLPAGFNQDTNNVSPRIGLAWSPTAKWVLRAGYGIFFDRYVLANLTRAIENNGSNGFEQVANGSAAAAIFAAAQGGSLTAPTPGIAPSIFRPDPRMATPYSQQASAGTEYLIAKDMAARIDYLFVNGVKLPRTLNVNLLSPVILTAANAPSLGIINLTPQQMGREVFSPARQNTSFDNIYELQNSAKSSYNGVSLTLSRKMNEDLEFSGSYTLSKTYDDASDYDEQPQNPFDLAAERALSRQDQRHRFVFNALWELPIGDDEDTGGKPQPNPGWITRTFSHIEMAPIFTAESGRPVDPSTGVDSNQNQAFPLSARPLGFTRDSIQTPRLVTMDFRILKYFPFGESRHLDVVAEFFNLFNRANVAEINPFFGPGLTPITGFGQPIEGTGARQVQFSLDFEF